MTTNEQVAKLCDWQYYKKLDMCNAGVPLLLQPDRNPGDAFAALEVFCHKHNRWAEVSFGRKPSVCTMYADSGVYLGRCSGNLCDAVCAAIIAAGDKL